MLHHMPPLTRRKHRRNDTSHMPFLLYNHILGKKKTGLFPTISFREVNLYLGDITLYLEELGPPFGKIGMTEKTCPSLAFFLAEVKLSTIFSLREKILSFGGVILSSCRNLLFLRGTTLSPDPPLRLLPFALSLVTITFPTALSFRGVNLPLEKKDLFLEEHSMNLHVSFSL